jgi:hypothetical protein
MDDSTNNTQGAWWVYQGYDGQQLSISQEELIGAIRVAGPFTWEEATQWMSEHNNDD